MNRVAPLSNYFDLAYSMGRKQIFEHRRLALLSLVVASAMGATAYIYRRLHEPHVIPFNRWSVTLGLSTQVGLTADELSDLKAASGNYPPLELVRRLCASQKNDLSNDPIYHFSEDSLPNSLEDEQAAFMLKFARALQPVFAFIRKSRLSWQDLLQPIQSSPRLAYTLLFNFVAPFAAKTVWEGVQEYLPASLQDGGKLYLEHKGKIAVGAALLIVWLSYRMSHERGIITNLTDNYATFHKAHRGYDLIPSYRNGLDQLLRIIGSANPGQNGANILWFYNENTHRTFIDSIGDILAEMIVTGRVHDNKDLSSELPELKSLQIVEFNIKQFLTVYLDREAVYQGWRDTLRHLSAGGNTLVVFKNIDAIKTHLYTKPLRSRSPDEKNPLDTPYFQSETPREKILCDLITLSLQQGDFRCLIEMDEHDRTRLESEKQLFRLFSPIRAPDVRVEELKKACVRLFSPSLAQEDIDRLFQHLSKTLEITPIPPDEIIDVLQIAQREHARSWRPKVHDRSALEQIKKAQQQFYEIEQLKKQLLQKIWRYKRINQPVDQSLLIALQIIQQLVPLYRDASTELTKRHLLPLNLVDPVQKRFARLFGACTPNEEERLKTLPARVKSRIKGQDAAIDQICAEVHKWRKVPPANGKPLVLFFAGGTGVGKSQTATHLAFELNSTYGVAETAVRTSEANVKRINLNRSEQGGILGWDKTKAAILCHVLHEPTSIVILEEWDKMATADKSSLLELLDGTNNYLEEPWGYGSTNGPYVDLSNTIFILTANIVSEDQTEENIRKGIEKCYPLEKPQDSQAFLSRVDSVIPFQKITPKTTPDLVSEYLDQHITAGTLSADKRAQVEQSLSNCSVTDTRQLQRLVQDAIYSALK